MNRSLWPWVGLHAWAALLLIGLAPAVLADEGWLAAPFTPLQLSIAGGESQLFERQVPVYGLRLSALHGSQSRVVGLDLGAFNDADSLTGLGLGAVNSAGDEAKGAVQLGLGNMSRGPLTGVQLGMFNGALDDAIGVQLGAMNHAGTLSGLQLSVLNDTGSMTGASIGVCNRARGESLGAQIGVVCGYVKGDFEGLQTGGANLIRGELTGVQIGALNSTEGGEGFQLGFVNHAKSFRGLQVGILNFNENGLLPLLPLFNYGL
jgi:hypothetical protein